MDRLPIDFIDWHFPTVDPGLSQFDREVEDVRSWLADAGYSDDIPIVIGEWSYPIRDDSGASTIASSYVVAMVQKMMDLGMSMHAHTSFYDQHGWSSGRWTYVSMFSYYEPGVLRMNLRTLSYVVRPKFNAFVLISMVGDRRLKMEMDDPYVVGSAWRGDDEVDVLLANYIPPLLGRVVEAVGGELSDEERSELKSCMVTKLGIFGDLADVSVEELMPAFRSCLSAVIPDRADAIEEKIDRGLQKSAFETCDRAYYSSRLALGFC